MLAGLAGHMGCKPQGYISMYWTGGCSTCLSAQSHRLLESRESGDVENTFPPLNPGYLAASAAESMSVGSKCSSPGWLHPGAALGMKLFVQAV